MPDVIRISPPRSHAFVKSIRLSHRMASDRDNIVADAVVLDDLRGVDSHRINRLPSYIARIKAGVLATNPVLASLDVNNTFGFVVGSLVINERIEIASTYGLAVVGVRPSNHYRIVSTYIHHASTSIRRFCLHEC
jgi:LDH2 family malate/lactate/ureidoglycolate dehydrogenase